MLISEIKEIDKSLKDQDLLEMQSDGISYRVPFLKFYNWVKQKLNLSAIAYTGRFSDLVGVPPLPTKGYIDSQDQSFYTQAKQYADLGDNSNRLQIDELNTSLAVVAKTGRYSDLIQRPDLSLLATKSEVVALQSSIENKVDKEDGKELSENSFTDYDKTKLDGIQAGATKNSPDVFLLNRENHYGPLNISGLGLSDVAVSGDYVDLINTPDLTVYATTEQLTTGLDTKVDKVVGKQLSDENFTLEEKTKLTGIAPEATKNDTDASLRDRATHTGTQAIDTVSGLQAALDSKLEESDISALATTVYVDAQDAATLTGANTFTTDAVATAVTGVNQSISTLDASLAPVAKTGSYNDLTNKPTIPAAQVNSDWTAVSGVSQILNKPTLGTAAAQNVSAFATAAQGVLADSAIQVADLAPYALETDIPSTADELPEGVINKYITQAEKDKLSGLESSHYKGYYTSVAEMTASVVSPVSGDYADVDEGVGSDILRYIWDDSDGQWVPQAGESAPITASQVKTLYESNPDTNAFTDIEKSKLTGVAAGATANDTNAQLRDRATHTGTQAASTITGLATVATSGAAIDVSFDNSSTPSFPNTNVQDSIVNLANAIPALFTQIDTKEPIIEAGLTTQFYRGDKTWAEIPSPENRLEKVSPDQSSVSVKWSADVLEVVDSTLPTSLLELYSTGVDVTSNDPLAPAFTSLSSSGVYSEDTGRNEDMEVGTGGFHFNSYPVGTAAHSFSLENGSSEEGGERPPSLTYSGSTYMSIAGDGPLRYSGVTPTFDNPNDITNKGYVDNNFVGSVGPTDGTLAGWIPQSLTGAPVDFLGAYKQFSETSYNYSGLYANGLGIGVSTGGVERLLSVDMDQIYFINPDNKYSIGGGKLTYTDPVAITDPEDIVNKAYVDTAIAGVVVPTSSDDLTQGTTNLFLTGAERTKLGGIQAGAQVNTVTSVAGKTGVVTLVKGDVGLSNVDNTSDVNKPVSTAQAASIDTKLNKASNLSDLPSPTTARASLGLGSLSTSNVTVSTADPSGGVDGDIWLKVE